MPEDHRHCSREEDTGGADDACLVRPEVVAAWTGAESVGRHLRVMPSSEWRDATRRAIITRRGCRRAVFTDGAYSSCAKPRPAALGNQYPYRFMTPQLGAGQHDDAPAVAALIYETASGLYGGSAGRRRALRALTAAYSRKGSSASSEVVTVARVRGEVAGMVAAFPAEQIERRAERLMRIMLIRSAAWHWPHIVRSFRHAALMTPTPPPDALYVDALATAERHRLRGVARALLSETARAARRRGLGAVALETAAGNTAARSLYEAAGFEATERRAALDGIPSLVAYVKRL